ncbi:MAG: hypothetical protein ACM3VV_03975 [Deltaproteobacteria bacterium]|nr:hypothetical protein [Nitrososphaeraceae archaeon]
MSFQKEEKEINDIEQKQKDKNLSSNEINVDNYHFNVTDHSNFSHENYKAPSRNFDNFIHNQQTIKTVKEIKCNFIEEHKNIINTYCSIYSKRLDDIIYYNWNNSKTMEEYSNACSEINQNLRDNQTNTTTRIINDIVDKKWIHFLNQ